MLLLSLGIHFACYQVQTVEVNNLKLPPNTVTSPLDQLGKVEQVGTGSVPLILLPGVPFTSAIWQGFMQRNASRYTMYAVSFAGYGDVPPYAIPEGGQYEKGIWTNAIVDGIIKFVKQNHLVKPIIVGHHLMADTYAIRAALKEPDLFGGVLVLSGQIKWPVQVPKDADGNQPPRQPTNKERESVVYKQMMPFYKTVSKSTFQANQFPATMFSENKTRGASLHMEEINSSIPVQVQYFLEYMAYDITADFSKVKAPTLFIAQGMGDFGKFLEQNRELIEKRYGTFDKGKEEIIKQYGGPEKAIATFAKPMWLDSAMDNKNIKIQVEYGKLVFGFLDHPEWFDKTVRDFVSTIKF